MRPGAAMRPDALAPEPLDKFLIGIVAGAVVLVLVSLFVIATRTPPAYLPETTPEAVASNYLLALQQGDYARAQAALSPALKGYPATAAEVADAAAAGRPNYYSFQGVEHATFTVLGSRPLGDSAGTVRVQVQERRFEGGGMFGGGEYRTESYLDVVQSGGTWKVVNGGRWFAACWTYAGGCR